MILDNQTEFAYTFYIRSINSKQMITKKQFIIYLIDCKGYDEQTAVDIYRDYSEDLTQVLNQRELKELKEYV